MVLGVIYVRQALSHILSSTSLKLFRDTTTAEYKMSPIGSCVCITWSQLLEVGEFVLSFEGGIYVAEAGP